MNHDIDDGDNYYNGGDNYYNGGDNYYNGDNTYYNGSGNNTDELNTRFLEFMFFILGSTSIVILLSKICPRENTSNVMDENLIEEEVMPNLITIQFDEVIEKECIVCLEEFKETEKISKLDCNHSYHDDCIQEWFQKDRSCPLCRYQV